MAIDKAKEHGVAAMTVHYQSHVGRVGDYPTMAVNEGMIGLVTADSGAGPKNAAPFGGLARRLGTNPISIGVPSDLEGPVLLDMATSAVAMGKINLQRSRNEPVPLGWIVDKDGNPTTDPNDYFAGGAILPVGADQGHKGYGLSFMVEMFSGLLTGLGFGIDPRRGTTTACSSRFTTWNTSAPWTTSSGRCGSSSSLSKRRPRPPASPRSSTPAKLNTRRNSSGGKRASTSRMRPGTA